MGRSVHTPDPVARPGGEPRSFAEEPSREQALEACLAETRDMLVLMADACGAESARAKAWWSLGLQLTVERIDALLGEAR